MDTYFLLLGDSVLIRTSFFMSRCHDVMGAYISDLSRLQGFVIVGALSPRMAGCRSAERWQVFHMVAGGGHCRHLP